MPQLQSALVSALGQLCDSNRALRLCLEDNESIIRRALEMTSEGVGASAVLEEIPVHSAQVVTDEAMMDLFDARDRVRKVLICEGLDDGMTVEQLVAAFHLSPDLVSSYVAERSNKFSPASRRPSPGEGVPGRIVYLDVKGVEDAG